MCCIVEALCRDGDQVADGDLCVDGVQGNKGHELNYDDESEVAVCVLSLLSGWGD